LKAIELALVQFNSQKGNSNVKIIVKDTGADPDQTAQAVDALYKEKVAAIIGPLIHVDTAAIQAQARELPIITLTQKDRITEIGDYVFRNFFTPQMQVKSLVSYAARELGLSRFAILYPDERYGSTFMNLLWDEVIAHEGIVVGVESYDPKQTDFAGPIKKLVGLYYEVPEDLKDPIDLIAESLVFQTDAGKEEKEKPNRKDEEEEPKAIVDFEAVFIPDSPKKAGLIIPQLAFYDVSDIYLLGTNLWNSNDLIEMAQQYVQAALIPDGFFVESRSEHVRHFIKSFEEAFNDTPGFIEAVSFDTAMILQQLTNLPDVRSRKGLAMALKNLKNFKGVTGRTSFTETGDVDKDLYILRIRGDKFVESKKN
jgi:ABC-type branched-subunit amino acid transport system substrate-binding protein